MKIKNGMLAGAIAAMCVAGVASTAKAASEPGAALAQGYVVGPQTKLQVYALMSTYKGVYTGSVLLKGWVDFKGISTRIIVGNPQFEAVHDGSGNVIGHACTARGAILWKGIPATLAFSWFDYDASLCGDAWWEIRATQTGALLFGSGVDWPVDAGAKVMLAAVKVRMPQ